MKKSGGPAVVVFLLLAAQLLIPATTWAASIYGPSNASASAVVGDSNVLIYANCDTGNVSSSALCGTGTVVGTSLSEHAFSASASGAAALASSDLSVVVTAVGDQGVAESATAAFSDTLYFHGGNAQQTGQITMTAGGDLEGISSSVAETAFVYFTYFLPGYGNGPWSNGDTAATAQPGSSCSSVSPLPSEVCRSSDGRNLSLTVTFPLSADGVYIGLRLVAQNSGDGRVNYTDPITLTLPPGVTFTSESGLFLTQPDVGVAPEPSTAALVGIALAGILGIRRRYQSPRRTA